MEKALSGSSEGSGPAPDWEPLTPEPGRETEGEETGLETEAEGEPTGGVAGVVSGRGTVGTSAEAEGSTGALGTPESDGTGPSPGTEGVGSPAGGSGTEVSWA